MKKHGYEEGGPILPDVPLGDDESERTELTCLEYSQLPACFSDPEEDEASIEKLGHKRPPQQPSEELEKEVVGKPLVPLM